MITVSLWQKQTILIESFMLFMGPYPDANAAFAHRSGATALYTLYSVRSVNVNNNKMCRNHIVSDVLVHSCSFFPTLHWHIKFRQRIKRMNTPWISLITWNKIKLCDDTMFVHFFSEMINMDKINPKKPQRSNNSNDDPNYIIIRAEKQIREIKDKKKCSSMNKIYTIAMFNHLHVQFCFIFIF